MRAAVVVLAECVHLRKRSPAEVLTPSKLALEEQQETPQLVHPVRAALSMRQVLRAAAAVQIHLEPPETEEVVEELALEMQTVEPVQVVRERMAEHRDPALTQAAEAVERE
jgi:hypothetical protein